MPLFRVTLVDTAGRQQIKEVHAGNLCGAKQQALLQLGMDTCNVFIWHRFDRILHYLYHRRWKTYKPGWELGSSSWEWASTYIRMQC